MAENKKSHYDSTDVPAALKRETSDGPGFESEDELPKAELSHSFEDGETSS